MLKEELERIKLPMKETVCTPTRIIGVFNSEKLVIPKFYKNMDFTENYDCLPLDVRMWLAYRLWQEAIQIAKLFEATNHIWWCGFTEQNEDGKVCSQPLLLTGFDVAVAIAPKWIRIGEDAECLICEVKE